MQDYTSPTLTELGTVEQLTAQGSAGSSFDKVGSIADEFTPQNPALDGKIIPDGVTSVQLPPILP